MTTYLVDLRVMRHSDSLVSIKTSEPMFVDLAKTRAANQYYLPEILTVSTPTSHIVLSVCRGSDSISAI